MKPMTKLAILIVGVTSAAVVMAGETLHENEFFSVVVPEGWSQLPAHKTPAPPFLEKPGATYSLGVGLQRGAPKEHPLERVIVMAHDNSLRFVPQELKDLDAKAETSNMLDECVNAMGEFTGNRVKFGEVVSCNAAGRSGACRPFEFESLGLTGSCGAAFSTIGMSVWVASYHSVAEPAQTKQHQAIRESIRLRSTANAPEDVNAGSPQ